MQVKNIARATLLTALAVALSPLSVPIAGTKAFPGQAMVNVIAGVLLGPWYAVLVAFATSVIRNLLGTGTLNAFAGSMIGALLVGLIWRFTRNLYLSALGEVVGTGILASLVTVYIVAPHITHKPAALATIMIAFLASTIVGAIVGVVILEVLEPAGYVPSWRKGRAARAEQQERLATSEQ